MIRPDGVDLDDLLAESGYFVYQQLEELVGRRSPGEEAELAIYCSAPRYNDPKGNLRMRSRQVQDDPGPGLGGLTIIAPIGSKSIC